MKIITKLSREKQEQMLFYLKFGTVMLWIDGRVEGVQLPENLKTRPQVRLNFDYGFEAADIRILPDRLEANLAFGKSRSHCILPMHCVYMMISSPTDTGCVFPDSIPKEMRDLLLTPLPRNTDAAKSDAAAMDGAPTASSQAGPRPQVAMHPLAAAESLAIVAENPAGDTGTQAPRRSGHLRVVK